jgi:hypothetical protein
MDAAVANLLPPTFFRSKNENCRRCRRVLATGSERVVKERTRLRAEAL